MSEEGNIHAEVGLMWTGVYHRLGARGMYNALTSHEVFDFLDKGMNNDELMWDSIISPNGTVFLCPSRGGDLDVWRALGREPEPIACTAQLVMAGWEGPPTTGHGFLYPLTCDRDEHGPATDHTAKDCDINGKDIIVSWIGEM